MVYPEKKIYKNLGGSSTTNFIKLKEPSIFGLKGRGIGKVSSVRDSLKGGVCGKFWSF